MALIKSLKDKTPQFGKESWLAETATIIGDFECGDNCSFWFNAVIRADVSPIRLGHRVNVQDNAMIHATTGKSETIIGDDVTIGHNAIVHGCTIEDASLIGMGAIVLDNAIIQTGAVIAAGAVVLENTVVEPGAIYAGIPAKKVKQNDLNVIKNLLKQQAASYIEYSQWYK